jgi:hypothetical protein
MPEQEVSFVQLTQRYEAVLIYPVKPGVTKAALGEFCQNQVKDFLAENGSQTADFWTLETNGGLMLVCALDLWTIPWDGSQGQGVEDYDEYLDTYPLFSQPDWTYPPR